MAGKLRKPLTRFDVSVEFEPVDWLPNGGVWRVEVRGKIDSYHDTFEEAENRWAEVMRPLPEFRG